MTNTKVSQKEALTILANVIKGYSLDELIAEQDFDEEDLTVKVDKMLEQLSKKSPSASKLNMDLVTQVREFLRNANEPMTVGEIKQGVTELANLSSQKVTPMVNHLVAQGVVNTSTVKGRTYYIYSA